MSDCATPSIAQRDECPGGVIFSRAWGARNCRHRLCGRAVTFAWGALRYQASHWSSGATGVFHAHSETPAGRRCQSGRWRKTIWSDAKGVCAVPSGSLMLTMIELRLTCRAGLNCRAAPYSDVAQNTARICRAERRPCALGRCRCVPAVTCASMGSARDPCAQPRCKPDASPDKADNWRMTAPIRARIASLNAFSRVSTSVPEAPVVSSPAARQVRQPSMPALPH